MPNDGAARFAADGGQYAHLPARLAFALMNPAVLVGKNVGNHRRTGILPVILVSHGGGKTTHPVGRFFRAEFFRKYGGSFLWKNHDDENIFRKETYRSASAPSLRGEKISLLCSQIPGEERR